jgi:hypothetical protein
MLLSTIGPNTKWSRFKQFNCSSEVVPWITIYKSQKYQMFRHNSQVYQLLGSGHSTDWGCIQLQLTQRMDHIYFQKFEHNLCRIMHTRFWHKETPANQQLGKHQDISISDKGGKFWGYSYAYLDNQINEICKDVPRYKIANYASRKETPYDMNMKRRHSPN